MGFFLAVELQSTCIAKERNPNILSPLYCCALNTTRIMRLSFLQTYLQDLMEGWIQQLIISYFEDHDNTENFRICRVALDVLLGSIGEVFCVYDCARSG